MESKEVRFLDTTFRDGSQSLWAMGIRHGMMEAIAEDLDHAGFAAIEVPGNPLYFKKMIRDLKEDPWEMVRMLARKMPRTIKTCMGGGLNLNLMTTPTPPALAKLFWQHLAEIGALNRVQMGLTTADPKRVYPTTVPLMKSFGLKVAIALCYGLSPRHTDEYYAEKAREAATFKPDVIYVKDPGGLLTVDRVRTLVPVIQEKAAGIPLELHSHCTTGLAPLVYLEALKLGVPTLHTGVPPLAEGSAQPSVLSVARNARLMGYSPQVDEKLLESISQRLTAIAKQDGMPIGRPPEYDYGQYVHQIPGGVISNLQFQLSEMGLRGRLNEVIEEYAHVRRELGYPISMTPYSQFVAAQAALNVAAGERYKVVIDEVLRFAQGHYGEDSGYTWMDQNLKDKLLSRPRAEELAALDKRPIEDISLKEIRQQMGGPGVSDEELLIRAMMGGTKEIEAMRAAGAPKQYYTSYVPLVTLVKELDKHPDVRFVQVQRGADSIVVQSRAAAPTRYAPEPSAAAALVPAGP